METLIRAKKKETDLASGFPAVARVDARVLILGSLPSQRSLRAGQYYAHPQNAFWRIMRELVGAVGSYEDRCAALIDRRIALWDVLASSVRPGSLDADIRIETAQTNDFDWFLSTHQEIECIGFNGRKAAQLFSKLAQSCIQPSTARTVVLPSTSPAFASMSFDEKLNQWRSIVVA